MLNTQNARKYCSEDIRTIENYKEAVNSKKRFIVHHRLETDQGLSRQELIARDLYYNRPASELICLSVSEHMALHAKFLNKSKKTIVCPLYLIYLRDIKKLTWSQIGETLKCASSTARNAYIYNNLNIFLPELNLSVLKFLQPNLYNMINNYKPSRRNSKKHQP